MRTDTIFYQLFQTYPVLLFDLLGLPPETADAYQFGSAEIKEKAFRFDGIFLPNTADKYIWFVEVQFQRESEFYQQFMTEIMLYLNQYQPSQDWRAVAIFPNRQIEPPRTIFHQELFINDRMRAIYLNELAVTTPFIGLVQLIIMPEDRAIASAKELVTTNKDVSGLLEFVETILVYKLKNLTREEIEQMFTLGDLKQTRVYQDAYQEALQKGRQEGKQEGKQEGRLLGKLESVPNLYALGLTAEQIAKALELDLTLVQHALHQSN